LSPERIVCRDLNAVLQEWRSRGFRLDALYPADEPHTALASREGEQFLITNRADAELPADELPAFEPQFLLTRGGEPGEGRAGMAYRDLIPGRLGGRYIASEITIANGGPVDDWVHYHAVAFQVIYVRSGWVRVAYEDQGDSFVMQAGDLVLQPPFIRHRVLESSPGLEVIEIGCPALHWTYSEHEKDLPNGSNPARSFSGQRFLRHVAADAPWTPFGDADVQQTAMAEATGGLAGVRTIRAARADKLDFPPHHGELAFGFVLSGSARLGCGQVHEIGEGDAFVIPPGDAWSLEELSGNAARGLHMATMGGLWQATVMGFGGVRRQGDALVLHPHLPEHWKSLRFPLRFKGARLEVWTDGATLKVQVEGAPVDAVIGRTPAYLERGAHTYVRGRGGIWRKKP
jgi:quercetin dioxygenase-like cupin family protein